jgi:hypothetical protein
MILAHIAGVPFEEWVLPLTASGGGIALALHAAMLRLHSKDSRNHR